MLSVLTSKILTYTKIRALNIPKRILKLFVLGLLALHSSLFSQELITINLTNDKAATLVSTKLLEDTLIGAKMAVWETINTTKSLFLQKSDYTVKEEQNQLIKSDIVHLTGDTIFLKEPSIKKREAFQVTENTILNFKYLNTRNGLTTNKVQAFEFDETNNLWAASEDKLLKLSGTFIEEYNFLQGLPDMDPTSITELDGKLYIGSFGQGLFSLEQRKLVQYTKDNQLASNHILDIKKFGNKLFISTYDKGLICLNPKTMQSHKVTIDSADVRIVDMHSVGESLLFVDEHGHFGSIDTSGSFTKFLLEEKHVSTGFYKAGDSYYSFLKGVGFLYREGNSGDFSLLHSSLFKDEVKMIFSGKSGLLWVVLGDQLVLIRKGEINRIFKSNPILKRMNLIDIKQDKFSNLWFASSNGGLGLINPSYFITQVIPKELISSRSNFLFIDEEESVYVEHIEGGIIKRDRKKVVSVLKHPAMQRITGACKWRGDLYFSSSNGLFKLANNEISHIKLKGSLGTDAYTNIYPTDDGLIINCYNIGVIKYNGQAFTRYQNFSSLTNASYLNPNGELWVANQTKGVSRLKADSVTYYNTSQNFPANKVFSIAGNRNGTILFGTNKGLLMRRNGSFYNIQLESANSQSFTSALYAEKTKSFWVSNGTELFCLSFKKDSLTEKKYTRNDFNVSGEIASNSLFDVDGDLFFKSDQRIIKYIDYDFAFAKEKAVISIKDISINNKNHNFKQLEDKKVIQFDALDSNGLPVNLKIDQAHNSIAFKYDLNYWGKEPKLNFYYRLKGLSNQWNGPTNTREIQFNNLVHGDYVLEVKVANDSGVDTLPVSFDFTIKAYFYQESYFVILLIIVVSGFLYLFLKTYNKFSIRSIDSYTSLSSLIKKFRIIAILAIVLFPAIAFYESEVLNLYKTNWFIILGIACTAIVALIFSFYTRLSFKVIKYSLYLLYSIVYSLLVYAAFEVELNVTMAIETALLLLFSKTIFVKLKPQLIFFLFAIVVNSIFIAFIPTEALNLNIYLSASIQCAIVVIALLVLEGQSISNLSFASKILESSDLFINVIDSEGLVVYTSNYLLKRTGEVEATFLGDGWFNYKGVNEQEREVLKKSVKETLRKGASGKYINQLNVRGELIDIEWSDFAIENQYVISIGKDVTEQLKFQKETEMLSLVATSVTNGVVITDCNHKAEWINLPLQRMTGMDYPSLLQHDIIELLNPLDTERNIRLKDSSQLKQNGLHPILFETTTGKQVYCLVSTSEVLDDNQKSIQKVQIWTDVSEQKQYERKFQDVINNAFDNIYTANYRGEFTYLNQALLDNIGLSEEELLGKHFSEVIHPDHKERVAQFYLNQFKEKIDVTYNEVLVKAKDNQDMWVGQNVKLVRDPLNEDKIIELHVVARDITQLKANQQELQRLSKVAERTTNIVMIFDKDLKLEWVNEAFTNVFGYEFDEVIGKIPTFLNGELTDKKTIKDFNDKLSRNERVETEILNYDKFGNTKWIKVLMDPILDKEGNIINYISVESDITKRVEQDALIKKQHKDIINSIEYSSRIQQATLPSQNDILNIHKDLFIHYQPKDIISGDFYLVDRFITRENQEIDIFVVGDCTGHGVPGAMLSVLCSSLLKEATADIRVNSPSDALDFAKDSLFDFFNSSGKVTIYDGMDVCFCAYNKDENKLAFSGANRPLYILRKGVIIEYKGDRHSVGYSRLKEKFTTQEITVQPGDIAYLFSDGIVDQFGGPKSKKFMSRRFKEVLIANSHEPMNQQKQAIQLALAKWQGDLSQTDDICLMAVKF